MCWNPNSHESLSLPDSLLLYCSVVASTSSVLFCFCCQSLRSTDCTCCRHYMWFEVCKGRTGVGVMVCFELTRGGIVEKHLDVMYRNLEALRVRVSEVCVEGILWLTLDIQIRSVLHIETTVGAVHTY
ncbi:hypothetical protein M758_12G045800 [Ceratodon purpureus]|nr:hypothetical protein M758_12G045800 [Ceratodon purpureus]